MFRRLDFAICTASPTPPFITIFDIARAKPLTCPPVIDGGSDSAFGSVTRSTNAGPGCASASRRPVSMSPRSSIRREKIPRAFATAA